MNVKKYGRTSQFHYTADYITGDLNLDVIYICIVFYINFKSWYSCMELTEVTLHSFSKCGSIHVACISVAMKQ